MVSYETPKKMTKGKKRCWKEKNHRLAESAKRLERSQAEESMVEPGLPLQAKKAVPGELSPCPQLGIPTVSRRT
jgi:hypothetical protein